MQSQLSSLRKQALGSVMLGLDAVKPRALLPKFIQRTSTSIIIASQKNRLMKPLNEIKEIIVVGGGKASGEMALALVDILGQDLPIRGSVNVPFGQKLPNKLEKGKTSIDFVFAGHPVPDEPGVAGTLKIVQLLQEATPSTLIFQLISGGGSALMPAPSGKLTLQQEQAVTRLLLSSGADISEINTVRRHMSKIKGGSLGKLAINTGAHCVGLILSDCIGDNLEAIAGGPTAPDPTTFSMALEIIQRYNLEEQVPYLVEHLLEGIQGIIPETLKHESSELLHNILIGSAETSAAVVQDHLKKNGAKTKIWTNELRGEASSFGFGLVDFLSEVLQDPTFQQKPFIGLIATGEFTVTLKGKGVGGRNQEMLLAFLIDLQRRQARGESIPLLHEFYFAIVSCAFDGIEGNSPAMGAIVDNDSLSRLSGFPLEQLLANNDSYAAFHGVHDEIEIGHSGTNVNDMLLILLQRK